MIFALGDALVGRCLRLGDALPWRRFFLAKMALGVSSPRRRLVLNLTPGIDFDFDFVNARIRDGTTICKTNLILPVDRDARTLPRQTWIDFCAVLASVLRRDSH